MPKASSNKSCPQWHFIQKSLVCKFSTLLLSHSDMEQLGLSSNSPVDILDLIYFLDYLTEISGAGLSKGLKSIKLSSNIWITDW